ncbi:MAG: hypothetical protein ACJ746_13660 [Bryobacteraceae bacterium]
MKTFSYLHFVPENPDDLDPDFLEEVEYRENVWRHSELGRAFQKAIDLDDEADWRKEKKMSKQIETANAEHREIRAVSGVLKVVEVDTHRPNEAEAEADKHPAPNEELNGGTVQPESHKKLFVRPPHKRRRHYFLPGLQESMNPNSPARAMTFTTPEGQAAVITALQYLAKFLMKDAEHKTARFCLEQRNSAAKMLGMHCPLEPRDLWRLRMNDPAHDIGSTARWISWLGVKEAD